jgi:glycosyltransferase involved in cell wall biosynthesis
MSAAWPSASALHVLMIALGDEVLTGWGDVRERHLEYAGRVAHLHMLVYSPRAHDLSVTALSPHLTVYPTRSATRIGFIRDACRIGRAICRDHPIDLITTQDPFSTGLPGVWLRRRFGIPLHVQNHSSFFDNPYWLAERPLRHTVFNHLGRWVLRRADVCRVVNHAERDGYLAHGLPPDRISVVPVPARLGRFTPGGPPGEGESLRERLGIPPAAPILLWIGRPAPVKRVPLLIDAFARVHQDHPDACLLLIGDFSSYPAVPAQVTRLGLDEVVRFAGQVEHEELPVYYRLCTVYVHSSAYEGFGLVLVEAASCARPVVATRTAGAQEVVLDGQTGLLCELEDPAALAAGVIALLNDPARATAMGRAGQAHVRQRFDRDRTLQAIIDSWRHTASFKGQL